MEILLFFYTKNKEEKKERKLITFEILDIYHKKYL